MTVAHNLGQPISRPERCMADEKAPNGDRQAADPNSGLGPKAWSRRGNPAIPSVLPGPAFAPVSHARPLDLSSSCAGLIPAVGLQSSPRWGGSLVKKSKRDAHWCKMP